MGNKNLGPQFRLLRADEIEVRIGRINDKGVTLLLYKDARCDMNILDETVGFMNWERSHEVINGNLYCKVSLWNDEKKVWVSKSDCGTKSYTEQEKGEASDSFKRACVNWGIGRELYTTPTLWVSKDKCKITPDKKCYDKFELIKITYDEQRKISEIIIRNLNNKQEYRFNHNQNQSVSNNTSNNVSSISNPTPQENLEFKCSECHIPINQNTYTLSTTKFKQALCINCQKKFKEA